MDSKITKEQAIQEIQKFVEKYDDKKKIRLGSRE